MSKICKIHGKLNIEDIQYEKIKWQANGEIKSGTQMRCRICRREKDIKWKNANREKHIASTTRWKKENREKVNEWIRKDRFKNPEKHKSYIENAKIKQGKNWRFQENINKYGITVDDYKEMVEKQDNLCAICNQLETRKSRTAGEVARLCIDHCHRTNIIRGLLCHDCNTGIGKFKDNIALLKSAISYLEKFVT